MKNTEFLNQIYPLKVEITPFLDQEMGNQANQGISECGNNPACFLTQSMMRGLA